MNDERLFVVPLAGQDFEFFAKNAEDDAVGLVDADAPPAAQVVAKGFRVADAGDSVAVDVRFILEKAVATARVPRAKPISLAEARRRGEFESYVGCLVKDGFHPNGEGYPS